MKRPFLCLLPLFLAACAFTETPEEKEYAYMLYNDVCKAKDSFDNLMPGESKRIKIDSSKISEESVLAIECD